MHPDTLTPSGGSLFYLMGASGAGKDSLINYARAALGGAAGVVFAHRYITRPPGTGGENHVALAPAEFELRRRHGLFLFDWRSHGNRYGIGIEVDVWLRRGLHVVVNGSREYLPVARRRVACLTPVLVRVSDQRLRERLLVRGREINAALHSRIARGIEHAVIDTPGLRVVDNEGSLEAAGECLLAMLREVAARPEGRRLADGGG